MIKTKLDLLLAAQATAQKNAAAKSPREISANILNDFDELKIDDVHFDAFYQLVMNTAATFNNLRGQDLAGQPIADAAPKPLQA